MVKEIYIPMPFSRQLKNNKWWLAGRWFSSGYWRARTGNGEIKNDQEKCGNSGVSCLLKMGSNS